MISMMLGNIVALLVATLVAMAHAGHLACSDATSSHYARHCTLALHQRYYLHKNLHQPKLGLLQD